MTPTGLMRNATKQIKLKNNSNAIHKDEEHLGFSGESHPSFFWNNETSRAR